MNAHTGRALTGINHLRQSIADILLTPIGSRCVSRGYGSYIFELIDHPGNKANQLKIAAVGVDALLRHEPRLLPTRFAIEENSDTVNGQFSFAIEGIVTQEIGELKAGSAVQIAVPMFGVLQ